ncbi:hypothetical protein AAA450_09190 [Staphylococcus equorum]|uniref:hypothetical protein n=1 Tax=Staphylococcus equorum TaxID=246432 RepID=UPI003D8037AD
MTSKDDVLQNLSEYRQQKQQESMNGYETDKEDDVVARMKVMLQPVKYKGEIYYKYQGGNYKADEMLLKRIIREDPRTRTIKQVDEVYKRLMIDLIEQERGQAVSYCV